MVRKCSEQRTNIHIVEVNCPYGGYTISNGSRTSKLRLRRIEKIDKYKDLVNEIASKWNAKVHFYTIVISSLGVVPKESLRDLKKLMGSKNRTLKAAKRIALAVLIGSYNIFYERDLKPTLYFTPREDTNDRLSSDHTNESNTSSSDSDVRLIPVASDTTNRQDNQIHHITSAEASTITPAPSDVSSGSETSH